MKSHRLTFLALALIAPILLVVGFTTAVFSQTAYAAPLETVTNLNNSGAGSLRQAIADVDSNGTIHFNISGTIVLESELIIDKNLTIQGNTPITISGNNATRVFNVTAGTVTFDHLTIISGRVMTNDCGYVSAQCGGGIIVQNSGVAVTVVNSTLSGNAAGYGAGIASFGTLTVTNSTLANNSANYGGGIVNNFGTLTVTNSILSSNLASINGGGIYNQGDTWVDKHSTLVGNSAVRGGGIYNYQGMVIVHTSTLAGNSAVTNSGGGIYHFQGQLTVTNSTLSGNSANNDGGGIYSSTADGACGATPATIIHNSTLSGNLANSGGGIRNNNGVVEISNSTITTNTATVGGGVLSSNDSVTCTRVDETIVAGNSGNDVAANSITQRFFSVGHNLIGTAGANVSFAQEFTATGDMTNTLPLLGSLADNGGPTLTHRPNSDSPAIDAGTADCGTSIDQRGAERPYNNNCDIGAVETQPVAQNCSLTAGTNLAIGGLAFNVANLGTLACIKVEDMGAVNHLLATPFIQTGRWWHVFGEDSDGNRVTNGFELTLTVPHANLSNPQVCKYPSAEGGANWDCMRTQFNANTVWLAGVDSFSDWAVGDEGEAALTAVYLPLIVR